MGLAYSGQISMGNASATQSIAVVEGKTAGTLNLSLRALSATAGKLQPDSMAEFYGFVYTAPKSISFTNVYSSGTSGTFTGNVTITGSSYSFRAQSIVYGTGNITTSITVAGQTRSATSTSGTVNSTTSFVLGVGTYAYSFTVTITSGSGSGLINAN